MEDYHHVFIPAEDIYHLSGPQAFKEFGGKDEHRNLMVISFGIVDKLRERYGEGDQDTLNHLRSVSKRSPVVERGQQVTVFRISYSFFVVRSTCKKSPYPQGGLLFSLI